MALGAAAVVRLTTGWIAARRKTTTRVVLVGEEEEQLQNQAEPESDSDTEPQLHIGVEKEQQARRGVHPPLNGPSRRGSRGRRSPHPAPTQEPPLTQLPIQLEQLGLLH